MFDQMLAAPLTNFSEDKLNLESFADDLTNLVVSQFPHPTNEYSKVIALNSGWGTGKTSFINMWTKKLETDPKFICLKYNAWENDDSPDALMPIICSFQQLIDENTPKRKELEQCLANIVSAFGPKALGLITQVTCGVNLEGFVEAYKEYRKKKLPDMIFEEFSARQKHKELFRKLTDIRGEHPYLLICIDELDRCRPTFAIETLEVVKHFFDLPNVVFVFSLDWQQLTQSIQTIYGNIDSKGYLQRFFDYRISLPEPSTLDRFLSDRLQLTEEINFLSKITKIYSIPLRTLNSICVIYNQFKAYQLMRNPSIWSSRKEHMEEWSYLGIYLAFIALKCFDQDKYLLFLQNGAYEKWEREMFGDYTKDVANININLVNYSRDRVDEIRDLIKRFSISGEILEDNRGRDLPFYKFIDKNIECSWIKAKETEAIVDSKGR